MERWGGESQVAGDGEELGESQPGPGNTCLQCPRGSEEHTWLGQIGSWKKVPVVQIDAWLKSKGVSR